MTIQHLTEISTSWIDGDGRDADLAVRVGRLGEDVSEFALRTMGWVRIVRFGQFLDIDFVPEAVRPNAVKAMMARIDRSANEHIILWSVTGRSAIRDDAFSGSEPAVLKRFVMKVLEGVGRSISTDAGTLERYTVGLPATPNRLHPMFQDLIATWNQHRKPGEFVIDEVIARWPSKSLKVMQAGQDGQFAMAHYSMGPAGPWNHEVLNRMRSQSLAVVPDRELATAVTEAAVESVSRNSPTLERWIGPLLTSQGVKEYDWYRLTLPILDANGQPSVLVGCLQSRDALVA